MLLTYPPKFGIVALRKESVDRNVAPDVSSKIWHWSLSARRAWIEININGPMTKGQVVALRKESVDRNITLRCSPVSAFTVALRKESVDRNKRLGLLGWLRTLSLSARRAWIEILCRILFRR